MLRIPYTLAFLLAVPLVACTGKPVEAVDDTGDTETGETDDTETGETDDTETGDTETGDTETGDTETGDTETGDTETGDTGAPNLLANPGFEADWDGSWLIYPTDLTNFDVIETGEQIYGSKDLFTADEGSRSLKVWGQYTGGVNETPVYQEYATVAGTTYTLSGRAFMHRDDPLVAEHTQAYLSIKYFDDAYNFYGSSDSVWMNAGTPADTWIDLVATGTVPEGATKVQAAIEFWQCVGDATGACYDGVGAVYFDDLRFSEGSGGDTGETGDTGWDTGDTGETGDTGWDTADTGDDTGWDTADTGGDTGSDPTELLANPGFEAGWDGSWLIYPVSLGNWYVMPTGEVLYLSTETFTAYEGMNSLKLYGQWTGAQNETPVYQEFAAVEGESFTFSGYAWMHHDDPLTASHTYAYLSVKYFDDSYNYYGSSDSVALDYASPADTWTLLAVTGTVPAGATKVQAAIEYWQCFGDTSGACFDGNGAVYFDDLSFQADGGGGDTGTDTGGDTADTGWDTADTGMDSGADTADTGMDSGTDTGTDTADTGSDTGSDVSELLANPSFESGWDGSWLIYPSTLGNWYVMPSGEVLYASAETFTAYEGGNSLKVYGQWSGWQNETPVYQEFAAVEGETFTFSGYAWMHHDDPLLAAHTFAYLSLKYFDDSYNYLGSDDSMHFDYASAQDTWTLLAATGTVPAGATRVQAAIEYWQCFGDTSGACWDGNGAVYFDDLSLQADGGSGTDTGMDDTGAMDTGGDTGADTGSDTGGDTGTEPSSLLDNGDFEAGWDGAWLIYPSTLGNWYVMPTGEVLYLSTESFTAYEGNNSLKLYGQWTGWQNETPVYQEFPAVEGEMFTFSGYAWMHHDDPLTAAHTYAYLSLKYFDDSYNYYGSDDSLAFDYTSPTDTWTLLAVTGTVPAGATKVQAAIEYWQCFGDTSGACWDGNGAVYFDDLVLE